jgi:hypothetical protein
MTLLTIPELSTRTVVINDPDLRMCYQLTVPARSEEDAWRFLSQVGSGGMAGNGMHNMYLGSALPTIRNQYYKALEGVEAEIRARQAKLGSKLNDPRELRQFVEWASSERTRIARLFRIPAGPGGMLGGEIRDWRQYGAGGRSMDNLLARAEAKNGLTGEAALRKILGSVDKPNPAATESILRGARYLRSAGAVVFVAGAGWTAYNIASAPAEERPELMRREGSALAGGFVASNVAIGICFLLGMTGVGLIAVGLVAGVAGAMAGERIYYASQHSGVVQQMKAGQTVSIQQFATHPR